MAPAHDAAGAATNETLDLILLAYATGHLPEATARQALALSWMELQTLLSRRIRLGMRAGWEEAEKRSRTDE